MRNILSDREIARLLFDWKYKGYVIVNLLSVEECNEIKNELDRLRVERNTKDSSWGEFGMYSHPQKESDIILKYFGHPKILEVVELLFGEETVALQSLAYFKPPNELGRDAHQDGIYSQSGWGKSMNVSLSLDESDEQNGGLWVYEASHYLPILPVQVDEDRLKTNPLFWKNERGKPSLMPEGHNFPLIYCEAKIGDLIFVHSNCVHGSYENKSNRNRNSLVIGYKSKSAPVNEGGLMKREPIDVYEIKKRFFD